MPDLPTILSSGAFSSVLVFLFRNWISERLKASIQHEYDQKLETHKATLEAKSAIAIEHLKSQLQIAASERSIKLSKIFERQAESIAEVYAKLVKLIGAIEDYTAIMTFENTPSMAERRGTVGKRMAEFFDYYNLHRIYVPTETQSNIDAFWKQLRMTTLKFMQNVERERHAPRTEEEDTWIKTVDFMNKDVVRIMSALDMEFKTILGIAGDDKKELSKTADGPGNA